MAIFNSLTLPKGKTFIRVKNDSPLSDIRLIKIIPHDEVYDGMEICLLIEIPTYDDRYTIITVSTTDGNINIPKWVSRDYNITSRSTTPGGYTVDDYSNASGSTKTMKYYIGTGNGGEADDIHKRKILKLVWDAVNSQWCVVSVSVLLS